MPQHLLNTMYIPKHSLIHMHSCFGYFLEVSVTLTSTEITENEQRDEEWHALSPTLKAPGHTQTEDVFVHVCCLNYHANPYLCPDSWAMVNARPRPVSSFMVQLRYLLHIPLIGAKPAKPVLQFLYYTWIISSGVTESVPTLTVINESHQLLSKCVPRSFTFKLCMQCQHKTKKIHSA